MTKSGGCHGTGRCQCVQPHRNAREHQSLLRTCRGSLTTVTLSISLQGMTTPPGCVPGNSTPSVSTDPHRDHEVSLCSGPKHRAAQQRAGHCCPQLRAGQASKGGWGKWASAARPPAHRTSSPRLPLGGQWGHDALPRQPHQLRLLEGVDANLSGKFKDFCRESQQGRKVRGGSIG